MKKLSIVRKGTEDTNLVDNVVKKNDFILTSDFPWIFLTVKGNSEVIHASAKIFDLIVKKTSDQSQYHLYKKHGINHKHKLLSLFTAAVYILVKQQTACLLLGQFNRDFYQLDKIKQLRNQEESSFDFMYWTSEVGLFVPDHIGIYLKQAGILLSGNQVSSLELETLASKYLINKNVLKVGG
jgi:hypothetical protein